MSKLLTAQEVADKLSIHRDTVRKWAKKGKLKGIRLGDGSRCSIRFWESDIEEWIKARRDASALPTETEQPSDTSMA